jgi:hypothetical protein
VRQTASPLVVAELAVGQFRLLADRPLATGVPRRPSPSSMTMSPWSDSLQRREDLAVVLTWPRGIGRSASEAREAVIEFHENHSHLFQLMNHMTISTDVHGVKRSRRISWVVRKGSA